MPTGDPMHECPLCKQIVYVYGWHNCTYQNLGEYKPEDNMKNNKSWWNEKVDNAWHNAQLSRLIDAIDTPRKKTVGNWHNDERQESLAKKCCGYCNCNDDIDEILNLPPVKSISKEEEELEEIFATAFDETKKTTLIVNLFGGPGTGKSTARANIFRQLKRQGIECEEAYEFAKDLVWEKSNATFQDQIFLFANQYHRIFRLIGQVDVVITDCPILLSPVYDLERRSTLEKLVREEHEKMWTYNVFLKREKKYNQNGRLHNEQEARQLDRDILNVLDKHDVCYESFPANDDGENAIVNKILMLLKHNKNK
jgi:hypothetical protein